MIVEDEKVYRVLTSWETMIESLIKARDAWEIHSKLMVERPSLDEVSQKGQKLLTRVNWRAKFGVMLPRFLDYVRSQGGFEEFLLGEPVELKKHEEEKETKNVTRKSKN